MFVCTAAVLVFVAIMSYLIWDLYRKNELNVTHISSRRRSMWQRALDACQTVKQAYRDELDGRSLKEWWASYRLYK